MLSLGVPTQKNTKKIQVKVFFCWNLLSPCSLSSQGEYHLNHVHPGKRSSMFREKEKHLTWKDSFEGELNQKNRSPEQHLRKPYNFMSNNIINFSTTRMTYLNETATIIKNDKRQFKCVICQRCFGENSRLERHKRNVHTIFHQQIQNTNYKYIYFCLHEGLNPSPLAPCG